MIVVLAQFTVKTDAVDRWKELISGHAKRCVELETGCLQFEASVDPNDATKWILYEVYADREAVIQHRQLPHFAQFFKPAQELIETRLVKEFNRSVGARKAAP